MAGAVVADGEHRLPTAVTHTAEVLDAALLVAVVGLVAAVVAAVVRRRRTGRAGAHTDRVVALRRLHQLRLDGQLSGQEFAREVARLDEPTGNP
ncbi:hypothetical protein [Cellulomonas sp. P5_C6]